MINFLSGVSDMFNINSVSLAIGYASIPFCQRLSLSFFATITA